MTNKRQNTSGIEIEPTYTPNQTKAAGAPDPGTPGEYPFTRGVYESIYRGRLWTMRQYAGFGTAEDTNRRFRFLLDSGQTGLSVAFDLPTQMGYDSDQEMAQGEVGRVGEAIDTVDDLAVLWIQHHHRYVLLWGVQRLDQDDAIWREPIRPIRRS